MEIKKLTATEATAFLTFLRQLDYETNFMLFNPDERRTTNLVRNTTTNCRDISTKWSYFSCTR